MNKGRRDLDRDNMAVELYFSVLRLNKRKGMPHKEAKELAYDAVELRYNISSKRLRNIMASNHDTLTCNNRTAFIEDCKRLIDILNDSNNDIQKTIDANNKLIKVLEDVCNV